MKKNILLMGLLLVLGVAYAVFFTDWFRPHVLLIHHTTRPVGYALRKRQDLPPTITFGFEQGYRLTELRVIPVAALATNANPIPLWHLVSESNSPAYESFHYGQQLRGMHPEVPGTHAQPLDPKQVYRLIVRAGKWRGQHDFCLGGPVPTGAGQ